MPNPFRIHGTVAGSYFTDRASEMRRLAGTLAEPGAKLLVLGERRVGKTSALLRAVGRHRRAGGHAVLVDCSTATSLADVAGRILEAAALGMTTAFGDLMSAFVRGVSVSLSAHTDASTGLVVPTLEMSARRESAAAQQRTVGDVLDTLERIAAQRGTTVGIVLDEFQEIHALGGEQAEWHLRGVMQHHQHLSYILSGSRPSLLREMLGPGRAFYQMLDVMEFGPIEAHHLGTWIDARLTGAKVRARGVGARCVAVAGPRTRDVVQLARKVYDLAAAERQTRADVTTTDAAFAELVDEMDDALRAQWEDATLVQRNVLRAVAGADQGLTTEATRERFALPSSSSVAKAIAALTDERRVMKAEGAPTGYAFDYPYFRGWVIRHALPDVGITRPMTALDGTVRNER